LPSPPPSSSPPLSSSASSSLLASSSSSSLVSDSSSPSPSVSTSSPDGVPAEVVVSAADAPGSVAAATASIPTPSEGTVPSTDRDTSVSPVCTRSVTPTLAEFAPSVPGDGINANDDVPPVSGDVCSLAAACTPAASASEGIDVSVPVVVGSGIGVCTIATAGSTPVAIFSANKSEVCATETSLVTYTSPSCPNLCKDADLIVHLLAD
jgi:hypothetical protein